MGIHSFRRRVEASKGANLSAQALLRVHIKAGLSLFPRWKYGNRWWGAVTTPMQGQHGYSLVQAACGASKVASLSAQALSGCHIKAGLSLFPPMEIRQSLVGALTASLRSNMGYSTRSGGVWSQQGSKLVGTGAVGAAYQGHSVALSAMEYGNGWWNVTTSSEQYGYSHEANAGSRRGCKYTFAICSRTKLPKPLQPVHKDPIHNSLRPKRIRLWRKSTIDYCQSVRCPGPGGGNRS